MCVNEYSRPLHRKCTPLFRVLTFFETLASIVNNVQSGKFRSEKNRNKVRIISRIMGNSLAVMGRNQAHHPRAKEFLEDYKDAWDKHRFILYRWSVMHNPGINHYLIIGSFRNAASDTLKESDGLFDDDRLLTEVSFEGKLTSEGFSEWFEDYPHHLGTQLDYKRVHSMHVTCTSPLDDEGLAKCKKIVYQSNKEL